MQTFGGFCVYLPLMVQIKAFWLWMGVAGCALLAACGGQQQDGGTQDSTAVHNDAAAQAPTEQWMVLQYDDMRLRETAGKAGKVLATLKEGVRVLDLGGRSEFSETVVLRGESITAQWMQVRTKEGMEGWMFGGALTPAPDPAVTAFETQLDHIKTQDCKGIQEAIDLFASSMKGKTPAIADQAMVPLTDFLAATVDGLNQALAQRSPAEIRGLEQLFYKEAGAKDDPKAVAERKAWEQCGLQLDFPEGILYLSLKPGLLLPTVGPLVSDPMRQYLQIRKKEDQNPWSADASLLISPRELADRAVTWDVFLTDHPDFTFKGYIRDQSKYYVGSLLMGQDNSPVFDYDSKKLLDEEFKQAWEWVLASNPQTKTGQIVQEWVNLVQPAGWKMTAKSEKYIQEYWDGE